MELGRSHQDMVHEDDLNASAQFVVAAPKQGILKKMFGAFGKKNEDLPSYLKKK